MKIAAVLALVLALAVGGWGITDYVRNEQARSEGVESMRQDVLRGGASFDADSQHVNQVESSQRFDGLMCVVGACIFIAAIVLFAKHKPVGQA